MRALITGGAGFIGSNIAAELAAQGDQVTVIDSLLTGYAENLESLEGVNFIEGDIRDEQAVGQAMQGAEVVFHLAASVGNKRSIDHPMDDAEINVLGTLRVLEAARREGVRKIVASSSAGIFGELKTLPIAEDHPLQPITPYASTKLCMENLCLSYADLYGMEAVCLRYFNVYGPNQRYDAYGNVIPIFVNQMLAGEPVTIFGDGEQTRDFVNVHDVVQANTRAAEASGVSAAFNIASGDRISINNLVKMLTEVTGLQPEVKYGPERRGDVRDSQADISAAQSTFGYQPGVPLRQGLVEYVDWYRSNIIASTGQEEARRLVSGE